MKARILPIVVTILVLLVVMLSLGTILAVIAGPGQSSNQNQGGAPTVAPTVSSHIQVPTKKPTSAPAKATTAPVAGSSYKIEKTNIYLVLKKGEGWPGFTDYVNVYEAGKLISSLGLSQDGSALYGLPDGRKLEVNVENHKIVEAHMP